MIDLEKTISAERSQADREYRWHITFCSQIVLRLGASGQLRAALHPPSERWTRNCIETSCFQQR